MKKSVILVSFLFCSAPVATQENNSEKILKNLNFTTSNGIEMVSVIPGSFNMGSSDGEADELPVHNVTLTKRFQIGKYEITQAQYTALKNSNPTQYDTGSSLPVSDVSWYDAVAYCSLLTVKEQKEGKIPMELIYRLPTEAEWEFAARGGIKSNNYNFSGSDTSDLVGWHNSNSDGKSKHPVGLKKPNELGIYDMSGNVWEWVHDWDGTYSAANQTNPLGPPSSSNKQKRGGGAEYLEGGTRNANRCRYSPESTMSDLGFRIVLGYPLN